MLYFYNFNTITLPDQNTVRRALSLPDLFTAVHDLFLTDSAGYADIVMPATSTLEHEDLVLSAGTTTLATAAPPSTPSASPSPAPRSSSCWPRARPG